MNATLVVAAVFVVLLALEWRYQLRTLRVGAVALALLVLFFTQPNTHRAARWAIVAPPAERITRLGETPLSEYASGVVTMEQAVVEDARIGAYVRLLCLGVLTWLACTPVFRRKRERSGEPTRLEVPAEDA